MGPALDHPRAENQIAAPFETSLNDSEAAPSRNAPGNMYAGIGTHCDAFGLPLPGLEAGSHGPDNLMHFSPMNLDSRVDDSLWLLPDDFYQSLRTFSFPTPVPADGDVSYAPWHNQHQPLDAFKPGQAVSEALCRDDRRKSVQEKWFTKPTVESPSPSQAQSVENRDLNHDQIDDTYRAGLSHRLAPSPRESVLPPAEFLVSVRRR